jgi:hypothetical protein
MHDPARLGFRPNLLEHRASTGSDSDRIFPDRRMGWTEERKLAVEPSQNMLLAGVIVGVLVLCLVPIIGGFLHYRRERLLTHTERMKALELGRDLPDDSATARIKAVYGASDKSEEASSGEKSLAVQCYTTTGWVAGCGLLFACWAGGAAGSAPVAYAIAAAAGAIGVTGMICGTILASKTPSTAPNSSSIATSKPRFDPEAV